MLLTAFVLCLSTCLTIASGQRLDLHEGEVCKDLREGRWICKRIGDCPIAIKELKKSKYPVNCGFNGTEPIVCCEPEVKYDLSGSKSKEMCEKYAESVFIRLPDELSEGGVRTYDTCFIRPSASRFKRIINGTESKTREYPHMALLGFSNRTAPKWFCGGTLISERFVLTTADCVTGGGRYGPPIVVRLGDLDIKSETDEDESASQPSEYEVVEVFPHPDYKRPNVYNDIGLVKLDKDVFFTEFIRPICLHTIHQIPAIYGLATGWGRTEFGGKTSDTLQTVNLTLFTHEECYESFEKIKNAILKDGISEMTMICAGDRLGDKDSCQGDSGGPLQIPLQKPYCMYGQVGITSFGDRCGNGKPGVYTRVSYFVPWIESIVWP